MTKLNIEQLLAIRQGKRNVIEKNIESLIAAIEENDRDFFDLAMAKIETAMELVSSFDEKILSLTQVENIASEITETADYEMNVQRKIQRLKKELTQTATQPSSVPREHSS